jgi:hypothetical protein
MIRQRISPLYAKAKNPVAGKQFWHAITRSRFLPALAKRYAQSRLDAAGYGVAQRDHSARSWIRERIPEDEHVDIPCICLTELYTPSTAMALFDGLKKLLAKEKRGGPASGEEILSRVRLSRRREPGNRKAFNMITIPMIITTDPLEKEPRPYIPHVVQFVDLYIQDHLPDGISLVQMYVCPLTTIVTAVTATFHLEKDRSRSLEEILGYDLSTIELKEAADEWRARLRSEAAQWLARRLPGSFNHLAPGQLPAIELMLTEQHPPWDELTRGYLHPITEMADRRNKYGWTRILDFREYGDIWQSDQSHFRLRESPFERSRHVLELAALRSEYLNAPQLDTYLPPLAARWALTAFLSEQNEQLAEVRDLTSRASRKRSPRALTKVQRQLMNIGLEGNIVAAEIVQYAKSEEAWKSGFPDFRIKVAWEPGFPDLIPVLREDSTEDATQCVSVADILRQRQIDTGDRIRREEADLRDLINAGAQLIAAAENLRLQRRVLWLTIVSVAVAVIAVLATIGTLR